MDDNELIAGLRTQPEQEDSDNTLEVEQRITGTTSTIAMRSLASPSRIREDTTISMCSLSNNRQVISWDRLLYV